MNWFLRKYRARQVVIPEIIEHDDMFRSRLGMCASLGNTYSHIWQDSLKIYSTAFSNQVFCLLAEVCMAGSDRLIGLTTMYLIICLQQDDYFGGKDDNKTTNYNIVT